MSKNIGFCVVGLGMGKARARQVVQTPGAHLVRVVDLDETRARTVGEELSCPWTTSLDEALADDQVDVVLVMTPSGLHGQVALAALAAGKHTITTKPMEVSLDKCDEMIAAADGAGLLLGVDFQERYNDEPQKVKYAIDNGLFGQMILGEARLKWFRTQEYYDAGGWRGTWKLDGGGALANQTVHNIDLLVWFMGQPVEVCGRIGTFTHKIETEDLGMAMVTFASGAVGTILGTTTHPGSPYWAMEAHGSEGGVHVTIGVETKWYFGQGLEDRQAQLQRVTPHRNVIEDVVSALNHGTALACDGRAGRRSAALLAAIYASARSGGAPVKV